MKSKYQDKWGMWHDKECINGEPSSNDSMILTAIGSKIGFPFMDDHSFWDQLKKRKHFCYPIERTPGKPTPYCSRDFMLGATYEGYDHIQHIGRFGWNFSPKPLPSLNIFKLVWQLVKLIGKHRNHFWMNEGFEQVYHVAFMVPFQDRAFYYREANTPVPLIYLIIEWIDKLIPPKTLSSKFICFLKYNYQPTIEEWEQKFGVDHPFVERVRFLSLRMK